MFNEKVISIKKAVLKDSIRIAKLHHTMWKSTTGSFVDQSFFNKITCSFFVDKWKMWLTEKNKITLLAEKNKLLLGFITIEIENSDSYPEIQFVYVTYKYQFNNLQKLLCEAAFKTLAELGFVKAYFSIAKENKDDLILYKLIQGYISAKEMTKQIFGFEFQEVRYEFDISPFSSFL